MMLFMMMMMMTMIVMVLVLVLVVVVVIPCIFTLFRSQHHIFSAIITNMSILSHAVINKSYLYLAEQIYFGTKIPGTDANFHLSIERAR